MMNEGIKGLLFKIRWLFVPYLVILICCTVLKLSFSREQIYFAVNSHNSRFWDVLAPYFTDLGDGWTVIILSILILLFSYRKAFLLITSYIITSLLVQLLKRIFDAPRPGLYFKSQLNHIYFVKGIHIDSLHSFPSGHTVTAFSAAVVITYLCKGRQWGIVMLIIACLIGFSRMYLSEHFFEDVFAGSAIGFFMTVFWLYWIDNQNFIHSPKWEVGLSKLLKS
jgi:membrane-associated phospholipid phosphatase